MRNIYLLFFICFGIFLGNLFLLHLSLPLPTFFSSYLNDLLCMPIVLSLCLFIIRKISKRKDLKISLFSAFSLATLYSIYFEWYLPEVTTRYTQDILDVLLYFGGALIFWLVQRSEASSRKLQY
ncbi:hypothetical protein [Salinimicrobium sediminilitoris]|uniref:hypothetical protein n=1 Tax=Salinimicrobium sediminilitoris TaxID=2876715 RepID=UPI001E629E70|nr:hypothetical protein [Salinimicrobium sediminilitoris]MCC8360565.1 hypothetical protein [Salinimicrobium sediminilitoris]